MDNFRAMVYLKCKLLLTELLPYTVTHKLYIIKRAYCIYNIFYLLHYSYMLYVKTNLFYQDLNFYIINTGSFI